METKNTLKRAVFDWQAQNFEKWLNQNPNAEIISISGKYGEAGMRMMSEVLLRKCDSVLVDISNLNFWGAYEDSLDDEDFEVEVFYQIMGFSDYLIGKMILNRNYGNKFRISNHMAFSEDGRVLVHMPTEFEVKIPEEIEIIGQYAIAHNHTLTNIELPQNVNVIDEDAFLDCQNLKRVILHDGITNIGRGCFYHCGIEELRLSQSLTEIPDFSFFSCKIKHLNIPTNVKHIGDNAFGHCCLEGYLIIPEGVETIGSTALQGNYTHITLPSTLKNIAYDFYSYCIDDDEDYPESIKKQIELNRNDFLPYVDIHPDNPIYYSENGKLYRRDNPNKPYLGCIADTNGVSE